MNSPPGYRATRRCGTGDHRWTGRGVQAGVRASGRRRRITERDENLTTEWPFRRFRMRSVAGRWLRDGVQIARFWSTARRPRKGWPGSCMRPEFAGAIPPSVVIKAVWVALSASQLARRSWKVRRYAWGLVCTARLKCFRRLAAVEKPLFSATSSIGRPLVSRSRWASWTRWRTSHWQGVVPGLAGNRRANLGGPLRGRDPDPSQLL